MKLGMLTFVTALALATPSFAHEAEKGPNGGRVADAGAYHVELVAKASTLDVFVTDAKDQPGPAGLMGVAILLVGGKQQRIPLASAAPGRLSGTLQGGAPAELKGVVQLSVPAGGSIQARFQ
jgi:hypothetical protein